VPLLWVASVQSTSTDQTWVGTLILHHPCTKITNLAGIAFFAWHICTDTGTSLASQDSHDATMWPSHGWNPTVDSKQTHQGLHHGIQKMSGTKEPVQTDPSPQTHHGWHRGVHKVHDVGNTPVTVFNPLELCIANATMPHGFISYPILFPCFSSTSRMDSWLQYQLLTDS
jgi:hypothetical protein